LKLTDRWLPISNPSRRVFHPPAGARAAESLLERYRRIRSVTEALCAPLEIEDYGVQPMEDASPPKWHLAHTSWFFETFLLKPLLPGYREFHPEFEHLFNSYYNGVGQPFPRRRRGTLSRPTVAAVYDYRGHVDAHMADLLALGDPDAASRTELGLNHEQQHQELVLTDLKYNLGNNPLRPAYADDLAVAESGTADAEALGFTEMPGGTVTIGADAAGAFCFDNEHPAHRFYLEDYLLSNRLVSNGEYLEFVEAGGYRDPGLWLSDAWAWLRANPDIQAPLYWHRRDGGWQEYRLGGSTELVRNAPVCHVSFYEADAYARFRGARLPREEEWEAAATGVVDGNLLEAALLHPVPAARASGLQQMFGDVWEWTASPYGPYPGFHPLPGTLGEYNGKFMSNQLVLRGGSCVSAREHIRRTYRNFFYPTDRWQFSGIRLARDSA